MKKSNLIRSDQPHTVNVTDGSNVAQRKRTPKSSAPAEDATPVAPNVQKVEPVKASKPRRVSAPPPTPAPAASRVKAASRAKAAPKPVAPTAPAAKKVRVARPKAAAKSQAPASAAAAAAPPLPPSLLWEQDNPVKQRIDQLRIRNAQLAEQLQRLSNSPSARGQRP